MKNMLLAAAACFALGTGVARAVDPCCGWPTADGCSGCAGGHCGPTLLDTWHQAYYDNKMWPSQYVQPSRRAICQSFSTMVNNGWRRQNLMGSYHFNEKNQQELTEAGRRKANWILTQAPAHRRNVFVERGANEAHTADRIQAVQTYAANLSPSVGTADVQETHLRNEGHPAGSVDAVFTGFSANQMTPKLPAGGDAGSTEQ